MGLAYETGVGPAVGLGELESGSRRMRQEWVLWLDSWDWRRSRHMMLEWVLRLDLVNWSRVLGI